MEERETLDLRRMLEIPVTEMVLNQQSDPYSPINVVDMRLRSYRHDSPTAPYDGMQIFSLVLHKDAVVEVIYLLKTEGIGIDVFSEQERLVPFLGREHNVIYTCWSQDKLVLIGADIMGERFREIMAPYYE
jgi:hypothetical protein